MDPTADELAGVADLFGALTRAELAEALSELAFKRATSVDADDAIDDAVDTYHLVAYENEGERLLAPGPAAFPELPEGAEDLPHIMDVPERRVDREKVGAAVEERFREAAVVAARDADRDRIERLLDLSYDLAAWGPVDVEGARERLREARE